MRRLPWGVLALFLALGCTRSATRNAPPEAPEAVYAKIRAALLADDLDYVVAHMSDAGWLRARQLARQRLDEILAVPTEVARVARALGVSEDRLRTMSPAEFARESMRFVTQNPLARERLVKSEITRLSMRDGRAELALVRPDGSHEEMVMVLERGVWKVDPPVTPASAE